MSTGRPLASPGRVPLPEPPIEELDATHFVLLADVVVRDEPRECVIPIPRGFVTDLASSPRYAYAFVDRLDCRTLPPIVHDWLYRHGGAPHGVTCTLRCRWCRCGRAYTRAEADRLFLALMLRQGVARWRAWLAYLGVRLGGASAWAGYAPTDGDKVNAAWRREDLA